MPPLTPKTPKCLVGIDPLGRHYTLIVPSRADRPGAIGNAIDRLDCPFCKGQEAQTPTPVATLTKGGSWSARIVPNRYPAVQSMDHPHKTGLMGIHEVVIETPNHAPDWAYPQSPETESLWQLILKRIQDHRAIPKIKTLAWFKNQGTSAGASLEHPHSQILGTCLKSPAQKQTDRMAANLFRKQGIPWLAQQLQREKAHRKRMVFCEEGFAVFCPDSIRCPFGLWIVPQKPRDPLAPAVIEASSLARVLGQTLRRFQTVHGSLAPYNLVLHLRMPGTVPGFRWYVELLPRLSQFAGWEWATETFIHPVLPEDAAKAYRL
ncbi:MAG: hypothetical protein NT142_18595 [Planctomycetota bacterium]|nr:hypothetical protein [Planctomycetota bacterium]